MLLLIAVIIALAAVSLLLSKRIRSAKDYMIGGGRIPFFVIALTMAATQFGGSSLIGGLQQGAAMGFWPGIYPVFGMALALVGASVIDRNFMHTRALSRRPILLKRVTENPAFCVSIIP